MGHSKTGLRVRFAHVGDLQAEAAVELASTRAVELLGQHYFTQNFWVSSAYFRLCKCFHLFGAGYGIVFSVVILIVSLIHSLLRQPTV